MPDRRLGQFPGGRYNDPSRRLALPFFSGPVLFTPFCRSFVLKFRGWNLYHSLTFSCRLLVSGASGWSCISPKLIKIPEVAPVTDRDFDQSANMDRQKPAGFAPLLSEEEFCHLLLQAQELVKAVGYKIACRLLDLAAHRELNMLIARTLTNCIFSTPTPTG
jgi:hypothetical protein